MAAGPEVAPTGRFAVAIHRFVNMYANHPRSQPCSSPRTMYLAISKPTTSPVTTRHECTSDWGLSSEIPKLRSRRNMYMNVQAANRPHCWQNIDTINHLLGFQRHLSYQFTVRMEGTTRSEEQAGTYISLSCCFARSRLCH